MPKSTKAIQSLFSALMLVLGWSGWFILKSIYPQTSFGWYAFLPATFWIMGLVLTSVLDQINKDNPRKLVNIYMMLKLSKLVIAMIMILIFYFLNKEDIRLILLVFAIYYAIYLLLEFYVFYITEKKIKQSK
jgi:hypothetical protein